MFSAKLPFRLILMLLTGIFLLHTGAVKAQCTGTILFPASPVAASAFNDTVQISSVMQAGYYFKVTGLSLNKSYVFTSSNPGDYITIRNVYTNAVLGQGTVPYTYNVNAGPDLIFVHLNLALACGTEAVSRTLKMTCTDCSAQPGKTGVNNANPQSTLDVNGPIKLGNNNLPPQAGMVRWNEVTSDFEGYNGTAWVSLTKSNAPEGSWGQISAATINENAKIEGSGTLNSYFGYSVSISGDYAIIGAYPESSFGLGSNGAAYIFVRNGSSWVQQQKIIASDAASLDYFGYSVSIDNDYAVVGAYLDDVGAATNVGSAYIFVRNGAAWTQQQKIVASDGATNDYFGTSVGISGNTVVVGAFQDAVGANASQGSAYVFTRNGTTWTQQGKLIASDGAAVDNFGYAVSIDGDYIIVGSRYSDVLGNSNQGAAYIFTRSGTVWSQQQKITGSDGLAGDFFGDAVDIDGTSVIVGAPYDDILTNTSQGSAYIFTRSGTVWTQQGKLFSADGTSSDYFGHSVSIDGSYVVVGAYNADINGKTDQGAAYIYQRIGSSTWNQVSKFINSDGLASDLFGYAVDIDGDYIIVGAFGQENGNNISNAGAAYIIRKN